MKEKIDIHYDAEGDYLELVFGEPSSAVFEKLKPDVFQRIDRETGEVRGFAVFNVSKQPSLNESVEVVLSPTTRVRKAQASR